MLHEAVDLEVFGSLQELLSSIAFRQHVGNENVGTAVVVIIGDVRPHGRIRGVVEVGPKRFFKGAVPLVYVEKIVLKVIIRDVDVGPPISIDVAHRRAKPITDRTAPNAGLLGDVDERPVVVPK